MCQQWTRRDWYHHTLLTTEYMSGVLFITKVHPLTGHKGPDGK